MKVEEVRRVVKDGANDVDVVISQGKFLEGDCETVFREIMALKAACGEAKLKVILETGALKSPQLIYQASILAMEAGADFIKTSTGKFEVSATPEAMFVMCCAIRDFYAAHPERKHLIGIKPAGGVVSPQDALLYYTIVL